MYINVYIYILPTNCFQMILICRYPPPPQKKKNRAAMLRLLRKTISIIDEGRNIPKDANCFDFIIDTCTHSTHAQSAVWAWGTSMYLDIKFHQYVTYVLAGCLEIIFWNYRKSGFFVRSNCYPCATVVR